jgi:hypothetical protein
MTNNQMVIWVGALIIVSALTLRFTVFAEPVDVKPIKLTPGIEYTGPISEVGRHGFSYHTSEMEVSQDEDGGFIISGLTYNIYKYSSNDGGNLLLYEFVNNGHIYFQKGTRMYHAGHCPCKLGAEVAVSW